MTTSKGPWSYDAESGYVFTKDTTGDWDFKLAGPEIGPTPVCIVESLDGIDNGDLLAAAPEMRDALRALLDLHIAHHNTPEHVAARAALAKAER